MIRQLTAEDDSICQDLITQAPAENLFIIGDIEAFGYDQDFQKVWGDFTDEGVLRGVLLRYRENYIPYAPGGYDAEGFASIINQDDEFLYISGLKEIVSKLDPFISREAKQKRHLHYAKCTEGESLDQGDLSMVKEAGIEDIPALVDLLLTVPEFEHSNISVESKEHSMKAGAARSYYIEGDGRLAASASTTAENSKSAMIVGVCTHADYKKRGYASKCMSKLVGDLLGEGKELCLFYDNPDAGKIYKRIGFHDIGYWSMFSY
ncbi:N-acetyltransferase [Rossellomorea marisflavi]|uniref:GNAT family N-acetyltransferase n=1 Tax=Rossellomorea marisflavi TaxID=189381 RepID=UPI0025CA94A2|nr:GNAT family N-acetyltransferase [Rossellomorea marisflavi]GLI85340.1 N-acetyltransferase [Rossellomorea marisflavi]